MSGSGRVLHHERVTAGDEPRQWLYVLHGIYGAGRNWGSVVRRLLRQRPDWGALLVDLRQHGASQGFAPPHTVSAAAADLGALARHTGLTPAAVLGHSFGGKVALLYGREAGPELRQVWAVDSTPAPREPSGTPWTMLQLLRGMPDRFATREDLIGGLAAHGVDRGVAQWMATNLEADDDGSGYRWRLDLDAIEQLLRSFFDEDAWDVVESPPHQLEVRLVKADDSGVLAGDVLARAERAAQHDRVFLHRVDGGHWVNAENPAAVEALLAEHLPSAG